MKKKKEGEEEGPTAAEAERGGAEEEVSYLTQIKHIRQNQRTFFSSQVFRKVPRKPKKGQLRTALDQVHMKKEKKESTKSHMKHPITCLALQGVAKMSDNHRVKQLT